VYIKREKQSRGALLRLEVGVVRLNYCALKVFTRVNVVPSTVSEMVSFSEVEVSSVISYIDSSWSITIRCLESFCVSAHVPSVVASSPELQSVLKEIVNDPFVLKDITSSLSQSSRSSMPFKVVLSYFQFFEVRRLVLEGDASSSSSLQAKATAAKSVTKANF